MISMLEHESLPRWKDYLFIFYFAMSFPVLRYFLDIFIFQKLARQCIFPHGERLMKKSMQEAGLKKLPKFTESAWKLTYYAVAETLLLLCTAREPWFGKTKYFWINWPYHMLKLKMKLLYTGQCGFYVYSVAALLVWETRRKDFGVMMTHHIITIFLITYSYADGLTRAGAATLLLHDISDIFMELAKLFKYSRNELGASISFSLFVVSWFVLRLIIFPLWVIWSISVEAIDYIDMNKRSDFTQYYIMNTLLIMLLILHVYWWLLIWRMLMKLLQNWGKVGDDVRSDSEDENN
ncbi:unnamed protein product [Sphagnum troendelagicum]|uniref:TLC domain-containing protein n=1 Tax=Sphagnum troendelagicum TaxID=128251 RepID=A0ABP0U2L0_9BRYO